MGCFSITADVTCIGTHNSCVTNAPAALSMPSVCAASCTTSSFSLVQIPLCRSSGDPSLVGKLLLVRSPQHCGGTRGMNAEAVLGIPVCHLRMIRKLQNIAAHAHSKQVDGSVAPSRHPRFPSPSQFPQAGTTGGLVRSPLR